MATTTTPMTVAAFLEMYPNAVDIITKTIQTQNQDVVPPLVDYESEGESDSEPSGADSSDDSDVEDEQIMLTAQPIKRPRGRPKKIRTPEELAAIAEKAAAKEQRRIEREEKKAAKAAEPKRPRGRPKKVRSEEELAEIAAKEEAKQAKELEKSVKKLEKAKMMSAKAVEKHQEKVAIYMRMLKEAEEYAEKWNIDYKC